MAVARPLSAEAGGEGAQTALMAGLGLGGIYKMSPKIRLHLLGEDNRGTYYSAQLRALAILEVDVSL